MAALLAVVWGIFAPLDSYYGNYQEFWFSLRHIAPALLIIFIALFLLVCIIGRLLPKRLKAIWIALIFGVAVMSYLQGNFMNVDLGVLDGKPIDWSLYFQHGTVNALIWGIAIVGVVIVAIRKTGIFLKAVRYAGFLFSAFLVLASVIMAVQLPQKEEPVTLTTKDMFTLSSEENVIVFVLDTFDASTFYDLVVEYPEIMETLDGFISYPNCSPSYPTTKGALPYLLTNTPYENEQPYSTYIKAAFEKAAPYYGALEEEGFNIGIYTDSYFVDTEADFVQNLIETPLQTTSTYGLSRDWYCYTAFRFAPHIFKQFFWIHTAIFDQYRMIDPSEGEAYYWDNVAFMDALSSQGIQVNPQKAYRFYHLFGLHPPYNLDENMNIAENVTKSEQARGLMYLLKQFIDQLKNMGIYDASTILITADHGVTASSFPAARPIFLFKPQKSRDIMKGVLQPISHADIMGTILDDLSLHNDGEQQYSTIDTPQTRRFLHYTWTDNWNISYLPHIYEYMVEEAAYEQSAYIPTGRAFFSPDSDIHYYEGTPILFDKGEDIPWESWGFSAAEADYSWSLGSASMLFLPLQELPNTSYTAMLTYKCTISSGQQLIIKIGNEIVFDQILEDSGGIIEFEIPLKLINENLALSFIYPNAVSPMEIETISNDIRILSVAWQTMQFTPN